MSGSFGVTYKQVLPKVFLPSGPSATKHGPNNARTPSPHDGRTWRRRQRYTVALWLVPTESPPRCSLSQPINPTWCTSQGEHDWEHPSGGYGTWTLAHGDMRSATVFGRRRAIPVGTMPYCMQVSFLFIHKVRDESEKIRKFKILLITIRGPAL
jgi:hypothetical protein